MGAGLRLPVSLSSVFFVRSTQQTKSDDGTPIRRVRSARLKGQTTRVSVTETRTLEFENARAVQSLYANDIKLLKNLEDSLGVRVTTREGWVKMEGEPEKLDRAQRVFDQLEEARKRGVDIQKHEFNYALNSVNEERSDNLSDAISARIVTSSRKAPVIARTVGQKNYVEAIEKHDVVFAIGPAGTGKTYLAVAMAVAALKKEQVEDHIGSPSGGSR